MLVYFFLKFGQANTAWVSIAHQNWAELKQRKIIIFFIRITLFQLINIFYII